MSQESEQLEDVASAIRGLREEFKLFSDGIARDMGTLINIFDRIADSLEKMDGGDA